MEKYFDPSEPGSFSGLSGYAKNQKISLKQAKSQIAQLPTYVKNKNIRVRFPTRPTIVSFPFEQLQIDLIDLSRYKRFNYGLRYILHSIDSFSKVQQAIAIKKKTAPVVFKAFLKILALYKHKFAVICSDFGGEFKNRLFDDYLAKNNMKRYIMYSTNKASIIESAHKTLLSRIGRYFTHTGKFKYYDVLPKIINSLNNTYHNSIKMTPNEVSDENHMVVWNNLYGKLINSPKSSPKFKVGDEVLITRYRNQFTKGYFQKFTDEIFKVAKIKSTEPITYALEDLKGEKILGGFYNEDLILKPTGNG